MSDSVKMAMLVALHDTIADLEFAIAIAGRANEARAEAMSLRLRNIRAIVAQAEQEDWRNVRSAYSGKRNKCMCGCAGKYWYASAHRDASGVSRGYRVTDDEVSDAGVRRIFNKVMASATKKVEQGLGGEVIMFAEEGERTYAVYMVQP